VVLGRLGGCQQSWSIQWGDRVLGDAGPVVGLAEAAADLGGEASLMVGASAASRRQCREPISAAIFTASG
jgi:hypothetical protein